MDSACSHHRLWLEILARVARRIDRQSFDTWFPPIAFTRSSQTSFELTVPNDTFRQWLLENYSEVLGAAIAEVLGAPRQLCISVQGGEPISNGPLALPVVPAQALEERSGGQWLIEKLWLADAVGILGGPPRAYKSWLALEMAVSVASGSPCLGVFPVCSGPVLLYAAEDSASSLRWRLQSLARNRQIDLEQLDIRVITADLLRLDRAPDQERFDATVALHRPKLLILDPLVRIHGADENASGAMAALLGYFRALQRQRRVAIVLVHHARKQGSLRAGYSLRGSSDFYAWTDCFLYLERHRDKRTLLVEHRSAPGLGPLAIELVIPVGADNRPYLRLVSLVETAPAKPEDFLKARILKLLSNSTEPLTAEALRLSLRARKQRLLEGLRSLSAEGKILRLGQGYALPTFSETRHGSRFPT